MQHMKSKLMSRRFGNKYVIQQLNQQPIFVSTLFHAVNRKMCQQFELKCEIVYCNYHIY